jgi:molecular chaperone GrpE
VTDTTGTPTPEGAQPEGVETESVPTAAESAGATEGAGGAAAAGSPAGGSGHHRYFEGGPGASSEPGGEDEFDHGTGESESEVLAREDALAASYLSDLQRLQAEYVNYKKRVDRDRDVIRNAAVGSVVESLLPVLDDIHMARQVGDLADGPFSAIADKLEAILGRYGVERLGEAGQEFDPNVHEALMHVEAELPEGATGTHVVQVLQPGYRIGERLVRAARVSVADAG